MQTFSTSSPRQKQCSSCGALFACGSEGANGCWCDKLPTVLIPDPKRDCYCPECLKALVKAIKRKTTTLR